jgi:hypothetical protein
LEQLPAWVVGFVVTMVVVLSCAGSFTFSPTKLKLKLSSIRQFAVGDGFHCI